MSKFDQTLNTINESLQSEYSVSVKRDKEHFIHFVKRNGVIVKAQTNKTPFTFVVIVTGLCVDDNVKFLTRKEPPSREAALKLIHGGEIQSETPEAIRYNKQIKQKIERDTKSERVNVITLPINSAGLHKPKHFLKSLH